MWTEAQNKKKKDKTRANKRTIFNGFMLSQAGSSCINTHIIFQFFSEWVTALVHIWSTLFQSTCQILIWLSCQNKGK